MPGRLSTRLQPNHPTDDPRGVAAAVLGDATKVEYVPLSAEARFPALQKGEVFDATFMSAKALRQFIEAQLEDAKAKNLLFSVHLKATMMKVSDPIIFGHFVSVYFKDVFAKHAAVFKELGISADMGLGDLYAKIKSLPEAQRAGGRFPLSPHPAAVRSAQRTAPKIRGRHL